jgi:hypothetical protein
MATRTSTYEGLGHAGAGTGLLLVQLSAIIPGLLPTLALLAVISAIALVPLLALGLGAALVAGPPYAAWRLAARGRAAPASARRGRRSWRAAPTPAGCRDDAGIAGAAQNV